MSFASLKKKIAITNQALAEKFSKSKRPNIDEHYSQLSKLIDAFKHYFEDVRKKSAECLEPSGALRVRPRPENSGLQAVPVKVSYPHAELLLGDCFNKYSSAFDVESSLGSTLACLGEGFGQLAEAKTRASEETKSRFVNPISETLNQDIKEIIHLRKKAENRRLAYEVERGKVQKGKISVNDLAYVEAERSFHEAYEASFAAMSNFLESEVDQIELLSNFISAQLSYVQDAQRVLSDLQTRVQSKLHDARSGIGKKLLQASVKSPTSDFSTPNMQFKPKYEEAPRGEPMCVALFDFVAENDNELSLKEGDNVKLIEQVDENWFLGELNGVQGHFPTSYVAVKVPLPGVGPYGCH